MTIRHCIALTLLALVQFGDARVVLANGDQFFEAQEIPGKPEYVIFGTVKDEQGQYLEGAEVTIRVLEPFLSYTQETNFLGHYRTLDVGRAVEGLGYRLDPSQIKVVVIYPGYHEVRRLYRGRGRQASGAIELNILMVKDIPPRAPH